MTNTGASKLTGSGKGQFRLSRVLPFGVSSHGVLATLALVLVIGLGLRLWSIGWGMPYTLHGDEPKYLPKAVTMLLRGDLNPHYFENPPFLTYIFLAELNVYLWAGRLLGFLKGASDVGTQLLVAPTPLYLMARSTVAVFGAGTALLTFLICRRVSDLRTSLVAALLLGVSFLQVRDSHYAVNDVPATFFLMLVAYCSIRIFQEGRSKFYLVGGIALGLGVATKYNVGLGAVLLASAHFLRVAGPSSGGIRSLAPLVGAGAASITAFVLGNPYTVLDSAAFWKGFAGQYGWTSDPFNTSDVSIGVLMARALWVSEGPVVLVASVVGVVAMAFQRWRAAVLLAAFPAVYAAFFFVQSDLFYARFAIPLLPFVEVFAAVGLVSAQRAAFRHTRPLLASLVGVAVLGIAVAFPLVLDLRHNTLLRQADTRLILGKWIEENVPPGSKLAVEGYTFLDSEGRHIGSRGIEYSLEILPSLRVNPLSYYRSEGFDYLIASSFVYGRYPANPAAHASAIDSYRELDRTVPVAAEFSPRGDGGELPFVMDEEITPIYSLFQRDRPGPSLKVYRLADPGRLVYSVNWLSVEGPSRVAPGQQVTYDVSIRNSGHYRWQPEDFTAVRAGYRWLDEAGRVVPATDLHTSLPEELAAGGQVTLRVNVIAPALPGRYTLQFDMVQENFAWFSTKGAQTKDLRIDVASP